MRPLLVHHQQTAAQLGHDVARMQLEHGPFAIRRLVLAHGHHLGAQGGLGAHGLLFGRCHHAQLEQLLPAFGTGAWWCGEGAEVGGAPGRCLAVARAGLRGQQRRFGLEIQAGHDVEAPQGPPHRRMHQGVHHAVVAELDLCLGGVDVDVDLCRIQLDAQEPARMRVARHQLFVGLAHRVLQVAAADEALIHEEVLFSAGALGILRLAHEALDGHQLGVLLHGHQPFVVLATEEPHDALAEGSAARSRWQVELLVLVVYQLERDVRMRQGHPLELVDHMLQLHAIALQELATGRHVVEQAAHGDGGARCAGHGLLCAHLAAFHQHPGAQLFAVLAGAQLHLGDGRDARQCLAAEALGAHGVQVVGQADLAGGVPLEAQPRIAGAHALAIIAHLHQRATGVLHHQHDARGARIHAVLQQFLHHARRPLHHLARSDLVGHMVGQQTDDIGHLRG